MADIDPATFEVVKNALYAAAEEMKVVLAKTAYSPLLKVAGDYSCGLFDVEGEMVAQGPDLPIHLGSMPLAVKAVIRAFPTAAPGDVFIHNDPYFGGSHLPDVNVVTPAFLESRLLGWACVRAHWPDIGSGTPGSYGAATEIYGEGLRLPPVRLYAAGVVNRDVEQIIFTNVRTPDERRGDLRAQIAANLRGTTRLAELAVKYGTDRLLQIMQAVMDYSERMMRAALAALPDGVARFEDFCDGDGVIEEGDKEDAPFWIRMQVTVAGDRLIVDFAGHRRPGVGADERAAGRHGVRDLHGDQDDRRPARPRAAQFRMLAARGAARRARHGGERRGARAGGLRQPRDLASRVRHAVRRARAARAGPGDGVLAGHLRHPDAGRRRLPDGRPLRELRDDQGRLRRPPDQGRHQRPVERHLEHDEHADRDPRDELSRAGRALCAAHRQRRAGPAPRRLRLRARLAGAGPADPGERLSRAHQVARPSGSSAAARAARGA